MAALTSALIGAGVSAAASAAGAGIAGAKRKKALRKQKKLLNQMEADNEADFLRDYYQNAFDDPSSRSYLKRISDELYDRSKSIENNAVATGATHESVQAQKQAANEVMSDAVNNVVVNHENRKQAAKEQYAKRKDAIASGNVDLAREQGEAQARMWTGIMGDVSDLASTVGNKLQTKADKKTAEQSKSLFGATGLKELTEKNKQDVNDWTSRKSQSIVDSWK